MRGALLAVLAVGCGGADDGGEGGGGVGAGGGDTAAATTGRAPLCADDGYAFACHAFGTPDCAGRVQQVGGWFSDAGGELRIDLAPDAEGRTLSFHLADNGDLVDGRRYALPAELTATLSTVDASFAACDGELWITHYRPGEVLWGRWALHAGPAGVCSASDSYASEGEFLDLARCPDR